MCTEFPASYWYCAVEENGVMKVVPDGYSNNNVTCTVDDQNCCVDNVLIKDDKVHTYIYVYHVVERKKFNISESSCQSIYLNSNRS